MRMDIQRFISLYWVVMVSACASTPPTIGQSAAPREEPGNQKETSVEPETTSEREQEPSEDEEVVQEGDTMTTTVLAPGGLRVRAQEYARHHHGGPPARVGHVRLKIDNGPYYHMLRLALLELLRYHCTDEARQEPTVIELEPVEFWLSRRDEEPTQSSAELSVEAQATEWEWMITFPMVEVYQGCDFFEYRVLLSVNGELREVIVPLDVGRVEPRR